MGLFGDSRINATFTASDKVTPVVKGMRREVSALGNKTGGPLGGLLSGIGGLNVGLLGLGAVGVGAVGVLGDFAKKAIEDSTNVAHLTAALKANVPAWNGSTGAIDAFIEKGQDLAFTDDQIRDSLAQLVTRTHDVGKAISLTRQAMDLARLKGISLADAATILGKVFSGQVSAAKRAGIAIDGQASSTEALAQIQKAAAGQADTYAKSQQGTLDRIAIKWDELTEDIGRGALSLVDGIGQVGTAFDNLHRAIDPNYKLMQDTDEQIRLLAQAHNMDADAILAWIAQQKLATQAQQAANEASKEQQIANELLAAQQSNQAVNLTEIANKYGVLLGQVTEIQANLDTYTQAQDENTQAINEARAAIVRWGIAQGTANILTFAGANAVDRMAASMEAYHHRNDYLLDDLKAGTRGVNKFRSAWRGAAINAAADIDRMGNKVHGSFRDMLTDTKADMAELALELKNGPRDKKELMKWLPGAMKRAHNQLLKAEKQGNADAIAKAKELVSRLNAIWQQLNAHISFTTTIGGGPGSRGPMTRASGGPTRSGETYIVGENGPETLHMGGSGGYVTQGRGARSAPSGFDIYLDGEKVGRLVSRGVNAAFGRDWSLAGSSSTRN